MTLSRSPKKDRRAHIKSFNKRQFQQRTIMSERDILTLGLIAGPACTSSKNVRVCVVISLQNDG